MTFNLSYDKNWTKVTFLWFYIDISISKFLKIETIALERLYNLGVSQEWVKNVLCNT